MLSNSQTPFPEIIFFTQLSGHYFIFDALEMKEEPYFMICSKNVNGVQCDSLKLKTS